MNRKQLPIRQHSPFAQRLLGYLRSQDPPMAQAEMARKLNVTRQTITAWVWNTSIPDPENVRAISKLTGVPVEALELDLEVSKGWQPPIPFADFIRLVEQENWADKNSILAQLRKTVAWQDAEGFWVDFARDVLGTRGSSLREKAIRLARIVQASEALGEDFG